MRQTSSSYSGASDLFVHFSRPAETVDNGVDNSAQFMDDTRAINNKMRTAPPVDCLSPDKINIPTADQNQMDITHRSQIDPFYRHVSHQN